MPPRATVVDLFAGAGGLSLGLSRAGLWPVYAHDHSPDAVATYRRALPGHPTECGDVHDLTGAHLDAVLDARPDWVVGGPPCQGYSTVGRRVRDDSRNVLFKEFVRVVRHLRPDGFVLENVLGLKDMRFSAEVAEEFRAAGYTVWSGVLSAADFGVPQYRRRVVFVGRLGGRFTGVPPLVGPEDRVTVGEAILDLPPLAPGGSADRYDRAPHSEYAKSMREGNDAGILQGHRASAHPAHLVAAISHIPDGGNRSAIPEHLQPASGYHNSYSRLASWAPAVAVTQNMGKPSGTRAIHPRQHRGLTTREGARLQSFPDTFHFTGTTSAQRLQVANAVPPLLAEAVGRAILDDTRWD